MIGVVVVPALALLVIRHLGAASGAAGPAVRANDLRRTAKPAEKAFVDRDTSPNWSEYELV